MALTQIKELIELNREETQSYPKNQINRFFPKYHNKKAFYLSDLMCKEVFQEKLVIDRNRKRVIVVSNNSPFFI